MYYLPPKKEKKTPQIDVFIQSPDGSFISLDRSISQLKAEIHQKKEKIQEIEKKMDIAKQRKEVLKKLIKNHEHQFRLECFCVLTYMATLGAFCFSPNSKVGETARWLGISTALTNVAIHTILNKREKKLKKQDAFLKTQERGIA